MDITLKQAKELVEQFGGDEELILTLTAGDDTFHSGKGLYADDGYPEHGYFFLGKGGE